MDTQPACPACGAVLLAGKNCQDHFHQMLIWEWEFPPLGEVHHLMVLCFHLQHPHLYSPEGLVYAQQLLDQFVEQGAMPAQVRHRSGSQVNSGKRSWKITGTSKTFGKYDHPIIWPMTAVDVVAGGPENYCQSVRVWAQSINQALKRP